jgi:hypothetical protein
MAGLPAEHLHRVGIGLPELLDRDLDAADLGDRRAAKTAEDVIDAPNRKTCGKHRHHHTHDDAAEPIRGGFTDTSKHYVPRSGVGCLSPCLSTGLNLWAEGGPS